MKESFKQCGTYTLPGTNGNSSGPAMPGRARKAKSKVSPLQAKSKVKPPPKSVAKPRQNSPTASLQLRLNAETLNYRKACS